MADLCMTKQYVYILCCFEENNQVFTILKNWLKKLMQINFCKNIIFYIYSGMQALTEN